MALILLDLKPPKPGSKQNALSSQVITFDKFQCSFLWKQTLACLTSDLCSSCCPSPSPFILAYQSPFSSPHPAKKSDGRKKWGGGGWGWRGLASCLWPLPEGLPHPSFRSHPSHLFLSVFIYTAPFFPQSLCLSRFCLLQHSSRLNSLVAMHIQKTLTFRIIIILEI